jgi:heme o synthase
MEQFRPSPVLGSSTIAPAPLTGPADADLVSGGAARPARSRASVLRAWLDLSKPGVTRLVLVTTGLGVCAAPEKFAWSDLLATVIGTALVVAGANALNMFVERESDKFMRRTAGRPLPSGRLSADEALAFGVMVSITGLFVLAQFVSGLAVGLAAFALLSYVLLYTPLKRVHSSALYVGAVPGALPPAIGYAAVTGTLDGVGLWLFLILFAWQLPHFLAIALFRRDEYARAGLCVLPNERGVTHTKRVALAQSVLLAGVTLLPVRHAGISPLYGWIAGISGLLFVTMAAWGQRQSSGDVWARRFFFASMPYLVVVMTALVVAVH